jgi:hypothetical protein
MLRFDARGSQYWWLAKYRARRIGKNFVGAFNLPMSTDLAASGNCSVAGFSPIELFQLKGNEMEHRGQCNEKHGYAG